ncbi:SMAD/FHA domain-containing protein [Achaetomium macrosporum]|uniref:SMAD/FHA domain-containing protein n=1 Tax=Achaetomium macrosporum TaxID=79813 RepID=A0AAN7CIT1_9PEZI|nr:SMAD/FHA domain-containing protein [Achaetomium macrosporum]
MHGDNSDSSDRRSSRRKHEDEPDDYRDEQKRRHREDEYGRRSNRSRSRERRYRPRSRTPGSRDRRSRSKDRERRRDRDPERDSRGRRREQMNGGRESRDRDDDRQDSRRRRSPDRRSVRRLAGEDERVRSDDGRSLVKRSVPLPSQGDSFALSKGEEPEKPKEKPNFGNSGLLAAASNSIIQADGSTITLKYHEPPEARKPPPRDQWKLFVFKGQDIVDTIELSTRSCWLIGRELAVVDLPAEHPSISKQHAVIQFRYTEKRNEFGDKIGRVKPYLIDLESANGTKLNGEKVPESRYLELRNKDMIQFGSSTREYVLMLPPKE